MPPILPEWQGKVDFWELVFGTWVAYALLVWIWERWLKAPLAEWRYAMITLLGASAYWINHYFQFAPNWLGLRPISAYAIVFFAFYWWFTVRRFARSAGWKLLATFGAGVFTVGFILAEQLARYGVNHWGMHEFCWMTLGLLGFIWLIWWRGKAPARRDFEGPSGLAKPMWRGLGGPEP